MAESSELKEYPRYSKLEYLGSGTIFLRLSGEERQLGMVTDNSHSVCNFVMETGAKGNDTSYSYEVIVLALVKDIGKNPLRTLLNWAAKYGG